VEEYEPFRQDFCCYLRRAEPRRQVGLYLEGLIGGGERKHGGNWPNMQATRRPGGCKRCLGARFEMKSKPAISAAAKLSSASAIPEA